jgi:FkbM family methyltransferase
MIVEREVDQFIMDLDISDNGISRVLYEVGEREKAFMGIINETVQEGMVCLDLGANIGYTTLFMLKNVGKGGLVYAIEPDPHNLELLKANIEKNQFSDTCEITQGAISLENKQIDFWLADQPNLHSVHKTARSTEKITVDAYTLESFLSDRRFPNFIKMDVEGHEVEIFEGGLEYFKKNDKPTNILVEVHPASYNEDHDFISILKEYFLIGFKPKYVVSTPISQPSLFRKEGYEPVKTIFTDGFVRGVYNNISDEHLLQFACKENIEGNSKKIVRSFMLGRG